MLHRLIGAAAALLWLSPMSAVAGAAEDVAVRAAEVLDEHCAAVHTRDTTLQAGSLREVATAWEHVSRAYDIAPKTYLLYWRGALADCLPGFEENAREDLLAFWEESVDDAGLAEQRDVARKRLRRLGVRLGAPPPSARPGVAAAVGLAAGAGVAGGLAGWQADRLRAAEALYRAGDRTTAEVDAARVDGHAAAEASNVLIGATAALAAGVLPALVLELTLGGPESGPQVAPTAIPRSEGLILGVAGRW